VKCDLTQIANRLPGFICGETNVDSAPAEQRAQHAKPVDVDAVVIKNCPDTAKVWPVIVLTETCPRELGADRPENRVHCGDLLIAALARRDDGLDTVANCRSDDVLESSFTPRRSGRSRSSTRCQRSAATNSAFGSSKPCAASTSASVWVVVGSWLLASPALSTGAGPILRPGW
jgi:hypothetical protein